MVLEKYILFQTKTTLKSEHLNNIINSVIGVMPRFMISSLKKYKLLCLVKYSHLHYMLVVNIMLSYENYFLFLKQTSNKTFIGHLKKFNVTYIIKI